MVALLEAAARSCAKAVTYLTGRMIDKRRLNQLVSQSRGLTSASVAGRFLSSLSSDSAVRLNRFLLSAEFDQLAFCTVAWLISGGKENDGVAVRDLIRQSLRHAVPLSPVQLTIATDVVMDALVGNGQPAIRGMDAHGERHSVVVAADAAASAVRGSDLLRRLSSLTEIEDFARTLRDQARAVHAAMRLIHVGRRLTVPRPALYVQQFLVDAGYPRTTLRAILARRLRPVVLGDPGGGKSTEAAALALQVNSEAESDRLALVFSVRDHLGALGEHRTFASYLEAVCRNPYNVLPPTEALEYLLLSGRATVIVDGFDEIGNGSARRRFATLLESFAHKYPAVQIVVTSRKVGYDEAALDPAMFQPVYLTGFTEHQTAEYVRRWFALDVDQEAPPNPDRAEVFLRETQALREIRENPLTLALLCGLSSSGQLIPRNRSEVYERCAALLFDEWDRLRGLTPMYRLSGQIRSAVANLAWHLLTSDPAHPMMPRRDLHAFLSDYMRSRFATSEEAAEEVDRFLDFCAGRAWMLSDLGTDRLGPVYGFTHRTFLEYFAAVQLVRSAMSPEAVWRYLRDKVQHPTWNLVAQSAVHLLERNTEGGATRFLELLLAGTDPKETEGTVLAAACLDSVAPSYSVIAEICHRAVTHATSDRSVRRFIFDNNSQAIDGSSKDRALEILLSLTSQDTRDQVAGALAAAVDAAAHNGDISPAMLWALMALDDLPPRDELPLMAPAGSALRNMPVPPSVREFMDTSMEARANTRWLGMLFGSLGLAGRRHLSLATRILCALSGSHRAKAVARLRQVPLASTPMPWIELYVSGDLEGPALESEVHIVAATMDKDVLMALEPDVRGTALLLLLPYLESAGWWHNPKPDDVSIWRACLSSLAKAHFEPAERPAASAIVASLGLPGDLNEIVSAWLAGQEAIEVVE